MYSCNLGYRHFDRASAVATGAVYLATVLVAMGLPALRGLDPAGQPPATAGKIETVSPLDISVSSDPR
jgi:hypothetical protein